MEPLLRACRRQAPRSAVDLRAGRSSIVPFVPNPLAPEDPVDMVVSCADTHHIEG